MKILILITLLYCLNLVSSQISRSSQNDYITALYCAPLELNKPSSKYLVPPHQYFTLNLQNQLFLSPLGDYITFEVQNLEFEFQGWVNYDPNSLIFSGKAPGKGATSFLIIASNHCSNITMNIQIEIANEPPNVIFLMNSITYKSGEIFCKPVQISDPNRDTWTFSVKSLEEKINLNDFEFWIDQNLMCGRIRSEKNFILQFTFSDKEFSVSKSLYFEPYAHDPSKDDENIIELYGEPICIKPAVIPGYQLEEISFESFDAKYTKWAKFDFENKCLRIEPHTRNTFPLNLNLQYSDKSGLKLIRTQSLTTRNVEYIMPFPQTIMEYTSKNRDEFITMTQGFTEDENIYIITKDLDSFIFTLIDKNGNILSQYVKQDVFRSMFPDLTKSYALKNQEILILIQNGLRNPIELFYLIYTPKGLIQNTPIRILDETHSSISTCLASDTTLMIASIVASDDKFQIHITLYDFEKEIIIRSQIITEIDYFPATIQIKKLENEDFAISIALTKIEIFFITDFKEGVRVEILPLKENRLIWSFEFTEVDKEYLIFWIELPSNIFDPNLQYTIGVESIPKLLFGAPYRNEIKSYNDYRPVNLGVTKLSDKLLIYIDFIHLDQISPKVDTFLFDSFGNLLPSKFEIARPAMDKIIYATDIYASKNLICYSWIAPAISGDLEYLTLRIAVYPSLIKKNYIPDVLNSLASLNIKSGDSFYYYIPQGLFADYDGDPLQFTIQSSWASFEENIEYDPISNIIKGSSTSFSNEEYNITIIAKDLYKSKAEAVLTLKIAHDTKRYWIGFLMLLIIMIAFIYLTKDFIISRFRNEDEHEHQNLPQFELSSLDTSSSSFANKIKPEDLEILIAQSFSDNIPGMYLCPITGEIMADPWILISTDDSSSHSYEKEAIESWMATHDTDPLTRQKRKYIGRNNNLRNAIEHFLLNLKVDEIRNDAGLRNEIRNWIRRRGGESAIQANTQLSPILDRLRDSEISIQIDNDEPEKNEEKISIDPENPQ